MATALSTDATLFLEDSDGNCTCLGYGDIKPEWRPLKIIDEEVLSEHEGGIIAVLEGLSMYVVSTPGWCTAHRNLDGEITGYRADEIIVDGAQAIPIEEDSIFAEREKVNV